jgi:glycogen operon protein
MTSWASVEGRPFPLGVTWIAEEQAYNFALYARHAERVSLLVYGDDLLTPVLTYRCEPVRNKSGHVWHCRVPLTAMPGGRYYAYSIDGPRSAFHRFDPDKVLFDP